MATNISHQSFIDHHVFWRAIFCLLQHQHHQLSALIALVSLHFPIAHSLSRSTQLHFFHLIKAATLLFLVIDPALQVTWIAFQLCLLHLSKYVLAFHQHTLQPFIYLSFVSNQNAQIQMATMNSKKLVGYWWSEKKSQKMNLAELARQFTEKGCEFVRLDLDSDLEAQGPFDAIIHKLSDVMVKAGRDSLAAQQVKSFEVSVCLFVSCLTLLPKHSPSSLLSVHFSAQCLHCKRVH